MSVHPLGKLRTSIISSYRVDRLFYPGFPAKLIKKPRQVTVESDLHPLLLHMFGVALDAKPAAQGDSSDLDYTVEWDFTYKADLHRLLGRGFGYRLIVNHNRRRFAVTQGGFGPKLEFQVLGQADDTVVVSLHMTGHFWNEVFDQVSGAIEFFRDVLDGHSVEVEVTADHIRVTRDWVLELSVDRFNKLLSPEQLAGLQRYSFLLGDLFTLEQFLQAPQQHRELGEVVRQEVEGLFYWLLESRTPPADHANFESRLKRGLGIVEAFQKETAHLQSTTTLDEQESQRLEQIRQQMSELSHLLNQCLSDAEFRVTDLDWLTSTQALTDLSDYRTVPTQRYYGRDYGYQGTTPGYRAVSGSQEETGLFWSKSSINSLFDACLKQRHNLMTTEEAEAAADFDTLNPPFMFDEETDGTEEELSPWRTRLPEESLETRNFLLEWKSTKIAISKLADPQGKRRVFADPFGLDPEQDYWRYINGRTRTIETPKWFERSEFYEPSYPTDLHIACLAGDLVVFRKRTNPKTDLVMIDLMAWEKQLQINRGRHKTRKNTGIPHEAYWEISNPVMVEIDPNQEQVEDEYSRYEYEKIDRNLIQPCGSLSVFAAHSMGLTAVIDRETVDHHSVWLRSLYPDSSHGNSTWKTEVLVRVHAESEHSDVLIETEPLFYASNHNLICVPVLVSPKFSDHQWRRKASNRYLIDKAKAIFEFRSEMHHSKPLLLLYSFKFDPNDKTVSLHKNNMFQLEGGHRHQIYWMVKRRRIIAILLDKNSGSDGLIAYLDSKHGFVRVWSRLGSKQGAASFPSISKTKSFLIHCHEKGCLHLEQHKHLRTTDAKLIFTIVRYSPTF